MDLVVSLGGLVVLSPILAAAAAIVWMSMGRPVIFRQTRPGRFGRPFVLYKFRTMSNRCDASGAHLADGVRLTGVGRLLRNTSVDELPQLINVLRGEMSLVGPRPLLMEYLPLYTPEQAERHRMKPGITGWTGVNGRNLLTWEEKFEMDRWYVHNWSILLDLRIIFLSVGTVLRGRGVSQAGHATTERFRGSSPRAAAGKEAVSPG
ncbi:MAG: sugar transferase [Gemmatimonadetes bacterium]|nr:sugar transferase [Gemmatimonadota bacterium]